MAHIIFRTSSKLIRGPYTADETPGVGESSRTVTTQEEATIKALRDGGAPGVVDDVGGLRAATQEEADEYRPFRAALLNRIKNIANLATRASAYNVAPPLLLALDNNDKDGAKAVVDTMTVFSAGIRTQLKALIDLIP